MRSHYSYGRREREKFGGIGILDVDRDVYYEPEYQVWYDMLGRCSPENRASKPRLASYDGCIVDPSFVHYSDFYEWMKNRWRLGSHLDKDIRHRGNKVYGQNTCLIVSARINKAFQLKPREGILPHGVKARPFGKFAATWYDTDGSTRSRNFPDPNSAHRFWQRSKADLIARLAGDESEEARPFILHRALLLLDDANNTRFTIGVL